MVAVRAVSPEIGEATRSRASAASTRSPTHSCVSGSAWSHRYWRGNDPELDIVARSVAGSDILLGEAKWGTTPGGLQTSPALRLGTLPVGDASVRVLMFTPETPGDNNGAGRSLRV